MYADDCLVWEKECDVRESGAAVAGALVQVVKEEERLPFRMGKSQRLNDDTVEASDDEVSVALLARLPLQAGCQAARCSCRIHTHTRSNRDKGWKMSRDVRMDGKHNRSSRCV